MTNARLIQSVSPKPLLQAFDGLRQMRFGEWRTQFQFGRGKQLVASGWIVNAFHTDSAHEIT